MSRRQDGVQLLDLLRREKGLLICVALAAATAAVYWQVRDFAFVHFDDDGYVLFNPHVQSGLTLRSMGWAFRATDEANWHPLTWISLMLDYQVAGLSPGQFHQTNMLMHIISTLLIFLVLQSMTSRTWPSAFAAALFALHPLHVQSVAWVSERKDVLSAVFWMLTMWAYLNYVEKPNRKHLSIVTAAFAAGLLAKPMLVTLPIVLLLIDYWPLRRLSGPRFPLSALLEKLPLFVLAAASSLVTFIVQRQGGTVGTLEEFPLGVRLTNAVVGYATYLAKTVWPSRLAVLYPHPGTGIPIGHVAASLALLAALTVLAFTQRRTRPYLLVGWLWFVVTLLPVIGLVQIGDHSIADRYTYIPLIGIFVALTWTAADLWWKPSASRVRKAVLAAAAVVVLGVYGASAYREIGCWRDGTTLFSRALEVTSNNYVMHNSLGNELFDRGDVEGAREQFTKALRVKSDYAPAHQNLGAILLQQGDLEGAIRHLRRAAALDPGSFAARANLGQALMQRGDFDGAAVAFSAALKLRPGDPEIRAKLQEAVEARGQNP